MAAKKKSGWTRLTATVARDLSAGRVFLSGNVLAHVASPSGRFFAWSLTLPPTEPKPVAVLGKTYVVELLDGAPARLLFERDVRCGQLAVSDEGVLALGTPGAVEVHHADGTRVQLDGHSLPTFDAKGVLLTCSRRDDRSCLTRVDARTGEVLRADLYDAGNIPFLVLETGEVAGYGGWLTPDGAHAPLGREWGTAFACGPGLLFPRAPDAEGESVLVTRAGEVKRFPDAFCATSFDGRFGLSVRYPPMAEAHAQGLSAYQARVVERVNLETGERQVVRALGFPEGRIYTWHGDVLTVVSQSAVFRYDIARDEVLTPRPLETRAVRGPASSHEDGVRFGEAFVPLPLLQDLAVSPGGACALATTQRAHVLLDRQGRKVREFERAARVAFCGDALAVVLSGTAVDLQSGAESTLALDGAKGLAALPDGFVAFFDKRIELRGLDGAVKTTWVLKAKPPKGFAPEAVTQVFPHGDGLLVVSKQALFRCDAGGVTGLLAKVNKTLGSSTPLRLVAVQGDKVAIAAFSSNESWNAVLVCTLDDEVLGWTGGLREVPTGLAWEGDAVLVTERSGVTLRFTVS